MLQNFHYAISLAQTLYDIDFPDIEQAEEIGLIAHTHIGNKNTHLYKTVETVDAVSNTVELPCNFLYIESVTEPCIDDVESANSSEDFENSIKEQSVINTKMKTDPLYQKGKFVKYRLEGNILRVPKGVNKISILYHGEMLDNEGLPYINDKEAIAIADYIGYTMKYKEAIRTNNKLAMQMATDLRQQWLFHCDAARVPEFISQNDMDKILDVQKSWNRKKYGFSFKPTL